jgi:transposase
MRVNQKPRRRHSAQFKAQVLAACAVPGASISAMALSFGINANLVHQWRRGRGFKPARTVPASPVSEPAAAQFVALSLPAPAPASFTATAEPTQAIRWSSDVALWA